MSADEFSETIMPPDLNDLGGVPSEATNDWALPAPTESEQASNNDFYENDQSQQPDFGVQQDQQQPAYNDPFFAQESNEPPKAPEQQPSYDAFGAAPADAGGMMLPDPEPVSNVVEFQDKVAEFNFEWEKRLQEQDEQEIAAKQALKEAAEKYLDNFHDKKTDEKLAKMESNRKTQNEIAAENERLLEIARSDDLSRWKRVYELVDTDMSDGDNTRMAKLLLNLKIKGKSN
jgi:hypothetical protein